MSGSAWIRRGEGDQLSVAVKDDGEGIPATAIPRLTERFYRVDVKRSRETGRHRLGLAIVKHIVSRHQGRLTIESKPGEGSTFTVLLPVPAAENGPKIARRRACHGSVIKLSHRIGGKPLSGGRHRADTSRDDRSHRQGLYRAA